MRKVDWSVVESKVEEHTFNDEKSAGVEIIR